jgi:ABC-type spermidine/putrescine transport system permease subunit I
MTAPGRAAWLALPLLAFLVVVYLWPVGELLATGFTTPEPGFGQYERLFGNGTHLRILASTFQLALTVTVATLVVAYPVAYAMSIASRRSASILLFLILVPFWTSILVRTYGWMALLGRTGIVNDALIGAGLTQQPLQLLFNGTIVQIAMVQILLPFMVLPLRSAMLSIDGTLLQAAGGLGAAPGRAFLHVFLPLSLPGIYAGSLIVFVLSFGFFITPALLGGRADVTVAMLIMQQFSALLDWGYGAALSTVLLVATIVVMVAFARFVRIERVAGVGR